jgi:hypothetical protein
MNGGTALPAWFIFFFLLIIYSPGEIIKTIENYTPAGETD